MEAPRLYRRLGADTPEFKRFFYVLYICSSAPPQVPIQHAASTEFPATYPASGLLGIAGLSGNPECKRGVHFRTAPLEHDPEKWKPVFGKDHAQTKKTEEFGSTHLKQPLRLPDGGDHRTGRHESMGWPYWEDEGEEEFRWIGFSKSSLV
jgi:hypothetical protein